MGSIQNGSMESNKNQIITNVDKEAKETGTLTL